jgi:hypothetical protein
MSDERLGTRSVIWGLQIRDNQPPRSASGVDQMLCRKARPCSLVSEVSIDSARANAHEVGRARDGPALGDVGSKGVHLALGRSARERTAQLLVLHADRTWKGATRGGVTAPADAPCPGAGARG